MTEARDVIPFFTKTKWREPPRIRHQLANLLAGNGHSVLFFQRPSYRAVHLRRSSSDGVGLVSHAELLNHQFRLFAFLRRANAAVVCRYIRKTFGDKAPRAILNFNYEYGFLRDLFPKSRLVTVINDDFESQAILSPMRKVIGRLLFETCGRSDCVLVTSPALQDRLLSANGNTQLFLPWAETPYAPPQATKTRTVALYWGYINHRIDWAIMRNIAETGIPLRVAGPVERGYEGRLRALDRHANVTVLPATPLDKLDLSDVCCSIIPYDLSRRATQACTPNKIFNLLARGIPSVFMRLDRNIEAPQSVVRTCLTARDFKEAIAFFRDGFHSVQQDIETYLGNHTAEVRYRQVSEALGLENVGGSSGNPAAGHSQ
jgi:hypothetical protein